MEETTDRAEWLEVLRDRYLSYVFFARIYRTEVDATLLQGMVESVQQVEDSLAEEAADDGRAILARFIRALEGTDQQEVLTQLACDYASLFLNAGPQPVFPYESVYTSPEKLLMQQAHEDIVRLYRQEGLVRDRAMPEPEDHIAFELEFMGHLCHKSLEALEAGDRETCLAYLRKQRDLLVQHLLVWVPTFTEDVERASESALYSGVARATRDLLSHELETIDALVAAISP